MLAARFIRVAKELIEEYRRFQITEKLNEAVRCSTMKDQSQLSQYQQAASQLREWAGKVLSQSRFGNNSSDLHNILNTSYEQLLPSKIANTIIIGFPDNPDESISSAEVRSYLNRASVFINELGTFVGVANKFDIDAITIPADEISFDVIIPRVVFENKANVYIELIKRFARLMTYLTELSTGTSQSPTLIYVSSSDPVIGLAVVRERFGRFSSFINLYLK